MDILTSPLLSTLDSIDHGFGTRRAPVTQDGMATLKQIHSAVTLVAQQPGCMGEGDALVTNRPGEAVSIRTADCLPILLADAKHRAVAAVHAGWRGTAAKIVLEAIEKMRAEFGAELSSIYAAIGPGIGVCCYQVGAEVARQFGQDQAGRLDLAQQNRDQLIRAGVPRTQIDVLDHCTFCEPELFHSYRRDKDQAGRMISYIRLR